MAADDLKISIRALRFERQRLSDLVLSPLQHIKDFVARNMSSKEVASAVEFLHNVIRPDTLKTITDGEALIAVLNLYYGRDNLRVLKRLLNMVGCRDLVEVLNEWESNNNPVYTQLFRECGYFALWLRIKCHLSWFSENKNTIFKSIKTLFGIPEIDPRDPELETLVFMGLSFGKSDILIYVLVPLCMQRHVRRSAEDKAVVLALEQLHIIDIYFRDIEHGNHSFTSCNPISNSRPGSDTGQHQTGKNMWQQLSSERVHHNSTENNSSAKNNHSNSAKKGCKRVIDPKRNGTDESIQVVQTSVGYIDETKPWHVQTIADSVRVVHPTIVYINPGDQSSEFSNLQQSKKAAHPKVFNLEVDRTVNEKVLNVQNQKFDVEEQSLTRDEVEGVIKQGVEFVSETEPESSAGIAIQDNKFTTGDLNKYWQDFQGNMISRPKTSVLDFSKDDSANGDKTETQSQILFYDQPPRETTRVAQEGENKNFPQGKPKVFNLEEAASKYIGNGRYTSTVTLQVNTSKKSTEQPYAARPMENRSTDHLTDMEAPLVTGEPNFVDSEVIFQSKKPINSNAESSFPWWYENAMVDDYYKEMKPEPEPGSLNHQHNDEALRLVSVSEEERATPNQTVRALKYQGQTPILSPPDDFRDVAWAANRLVKVKSTRLEEQPRHHPSVIALRGNSQERESPREATVLKNRGALQLYGDQAHGHLSTVHTQHKSNRVGVVQGRPRQSLVVVKPDSELYSDYEDSVFGESESHDRGTDRFAIEPPPYVPPPDYKALTKKSRLISSESTSTACSSPLDTSIQKSPLLSAASISSIYKEKELFLSRDELQLSIRDAENKEAEKKLELCKELLTAAKTGDEEEIKRTLEEGADVNYQNEFGHTAVMIASREGYLDVVESLIGAGADVDLQEGFGKSALHEAAWSGQHKVVHRLISAGANTNITDEEHRTPLHYAAMRGKRRITEVLLLFGADVSLVTKNGQSAVELAYCYRHNDIVNLLMSSRDKKTRKEMESQIRKQKLRQLSSATSLPNLSKASSMKELSRSTSRPDLRKKKSVCVIQ